MTYSTNFYYAILIATAVGATIFMVVVTLTQDQIFGSKLMVEVPTYDTTTQPVTGPNGTTFIEVENEDDTSLEDFPFVNGTTATINVEEYEVCVSGADAQVLESSLNMGFNTMEPETIELLKNISMGSVQNCIFLNSANQ